MILAILQARVGSSRLPGKVLKDIVGKPMLLHQIERVQHSKSIDKLTVATSDQEADNPLEQLCRDNGLECFRGNLDDVLDRYYQAAKRETPDHVLRLTGDCPLADPEIIDRLVDFYQDGEYEYASNTIEPTFPDGLDAEIFRFETLETAWREATLPSHREHVTPFMKSNPDRFRLGSFKDSADRSHMRWTVDEPTDFAFVTQVYERLYSADPRFSAEDVHRLLQSDPELADINARFERDEGLKKSLVADGAALAETN